MNNLKEINIKNLMCYYFDDIIKFEDFNLDNIVIDVKSYENILVYKSLSKRLIGAKRLCIRFDKIDEFITVDDGTRYLVLFAGEKYDFIHNRIKYLIPVKSGTTYIIFHNYSKFRVYLYDSLPLEKI